MGVVVRLLAFLVGALALGFVGLDTAQDHFGVDAAGLLAKMGEMPGGIATTALALTLVVRIYESYGTAEEDELVRIERDERARS